MDNERPKATAILKDFVGLYSDVDPTDLPSGGMAEQVNIFCLQYGSLTTRGGLKEVSFTFPENP